MTMSIRRGKPESFFRLPVAIAIFVLAHSPAFAAADSEPAYDASAGDEEDPTRPISIFDFRLHYEDDTTDKQNEIQEVILRDNVRIDIASGWKMGLRFDLPLTASDKLTDSDPGGIFQYGVGRALFQSFLANIVDERWAYGFGTKIVAPSLSGTQFGSGNWDIQPGAAIRAMLPEISEGSFVVPQIAYAQTFAQSYPGTKTGNLQFAPQLKIMLKDTWYVDLYPNTDIRYNFGAKSAGQTGRLFLPLDFEVGRNFGDALLAALEVSVPIIKDYPVYRLKIEARLSVHL